MEAWNLIVKTTLRLQVAVAPHSRGDIALNSEVWRKRQTTTHCIWGIRLGLLQYSLESTIKSWFLIPSMVANAMEMTVNSQSLLVVVDFKRKFDVPGIIPR